MNLQDRELPFSSKKQDTDVLAIHDCHIVADESLRFLFPASLVPRKVDCRTAARAHRGHGQGFDLWDEVADPIFAVIKKPANQGAFFLCDWTVQRFSKRAAIAHLRSLLSFAVLRFGHSARARIDPVPGDRDGSDAGLNAT